MIMNMITGILNWQGFLLGLAAFIMIGVFHPVVAKMEYHFGKQSWWLLFLPGLACLVASFFFSSVISIILGCLAFSFFWSTLEIFMQHERVMKGRAKKNPKRNYDA
jgi:hypothetical protein